MPERRVVTDSKGRDEATTKGTDSGKKTPVESKKK